MKDPLPRPNEKCAIPKTPINVASKFLGAKREQYVAAATHIRWQERASIASKGKHHQEFSMKEYPTRRTACEKKAITIRLTCPKILVIFSAV